MPHFFLEQFPAVRYIFYGRCAAPQKDAASIGAMV